MKRRTGIYGLASLLTIAVLTFAVSQQAAAQSQPGYQVLHNFQESPDGAEPLFDLVRDSTGNLYGITIYGGSKDGGTVYKIDSTGKESVLHRFSGQDGDGLSPLGPLVLDASGDLCGTTTDGGRSGHGTIFKLNPAGGETVLYAFTGGADGDGPQGTLALDESGDFYGTTARGGEFGWGTVFKLNKTGKETVLHSFKGVDEAFRGISGVVRDSAGNLYGTTQYGGESGACNDLGCGTVFKVGKGGKYTVLHNFTGKEDGGLPIAGVILDATGNLYGATQYGGDASCGQGSGCGVAFKLDTIGEETVLHSFSGASDGAVSYGQLVMDDVGNLYGTTHYGGDTKEVCFDLFGGCGVLFRIDTQNHLTVLHIFAGGKDGGDPAAGVIRDAAGSLYGTTMSGGDLNCQFGVGCGLVFQLIP